MPGAGLHAPNSGAWGLGIRDGRIRWAEFDPSFPVLLFLLGGGVRRSILRKQLYLQRIGFGMGTSRAPAPKGNEIAPCPESRRTRAPTQAMVGSAKQKHIIRSSSICSSKVPGAQPSAVRNGSVPFRFWRRFTFKTDLRPFRCWDLKEKPQGNQCNLRKPHSPFLRRVCHVRKPFFFFLFFFFFFFSLPEKRSKAVGHKPPGRISRGPKGRFGPCAS